MQLSFQTSVAPANLYDLLNAVVPATPITIFGRTANQLNYSFVLIAGVLYVNLSPSLSNLAAIAQSVTTVIEDALTS